MEFDRAAVMTIAMAGRRRIVMVHGLWLIVVNCNLSYFLQFSGTVVFTTMSILMYVAYKYFVIIAAQNILKMVVLLVLITH